MKNPGGEKRPAWAGILRWFGHLQVGVRRALIALALVVLALFFYLRSDRFQRQVERHVVAAIQDATGTRVELDGFYYSVPSRTVYLRGLTLHGREGPGQAPLFHADSVILGVRVLLLLEGQVEFRTLRMERPHLSVIADSQGSTNVPRPPLWRDVRRSPLDPIFDLAIGRLEVVDGQLLWNDIRRRFDFTIEGVAASLRHEAGRDRYAGMVACRSVRWSAAAGTGLPPIRAPGGVKPPVEFTGDGRAHFIVERRRLEVTELVLRTARSHIEASGTLADFRRPVLDLTYNALLDLSETQALLAPGVFRAGSLIAKGSGHYETAPGRLEAAGEARLERAVWPAIRASEIFASAHYQLTGKTLMLSPLLLSLAGKVAEGAFCRDCGVMEGRARVERLWESPQLGFEGKVQGLSLSVLDEELARRDLPVVRKMHWAAVLSGDLELKSRWPPARRELEIAGRLSAIPPIPVPSGYMALRGHSDFRYSGLEDRLSFHDTLLETPDTHLALEGTLGAPASRLKVSVSTTNAKEWNPVLSLPVELLGSAEFQGSVWGPATLGDLSSEGILRLGAFAWPNPAQSPVRNAPVSGWPGSIRFDRLSAGISYSPNRLEISNGRIESGPSSASIAARISLRGGKFSEDSVLSANMEIQRADLNDLRTLAGVPYPVQGAVAASLQASGTWSKPDIRGFVKVSKGEIYGEPFDQLRADVESSGRLLKLTNLELDRGKERVHGFLNARLDRYSYSFELEGNNLTLAGFRALERPNLSLAGLMNFRAEGSVEGGAYSGQADVRIQNFLVNGELFGNVQAGIRAAGDRLDFRVHSEFEQAAVDASADLRLREPFPLEAHGSFANVDWDAFLAPFLRGHVTAHNRSDGVVTVAGNLSHPETLSIALEVTRWQMAIENVELRNEGPWRAHYRDRLLTIERAQLVGTDMDLTLSGTLPAPAGAGGGASPLALAADGKLNLAVLHVLNPDLLASGQATLAATLSGTWAHPLLNGRVEFKEGQFGLGDFPNTLSGLNGALVFHNNGVQIQNLTGESGGGQVRLSGSFDYGQPPLSFRLRVEANGVRVRYPPGVSTVFDADLHLAGTSGRSLLSGEVTVTRAALNPNFDLAVALAEIKQGTFSRGSQGWAQGVQLDVRVLSSPGIQFVSSLTHNLEAEANLRLRGTTANPGLLGRVNILQGDVTFAGSVYTIHRGEVAFANPFRIEPVLNLDVSVRKQQYDISLDFIGRLDKLSVNYRSDPPLPVADIQLLLLVGRPPQTTVSPAAAQLPQIGGNAVLSQALNSTTNSRLGRFFSGSVKVDPQVGGPENNSSARLSLEQQVSKDIRFTYITALNSAQQQTVQVEWAVSRRLSVIAVRDQNGFFGVDLKWKTRFR